MRAVNVQEVVDILAQTANPNVDIAEHVVLMKNRYRKPRRYYHTFEHPREMFGTLLEHKDIARDIGAIGWAILYHDVFYDSKAEHGINEELSARLAEQELPGIAGDDIARRVAHYTRETIHHTAGLDDPDLDLFLDIDLTILGSDPKRYDRYTADVRKEYSHVPVNAYRLGRIAVLESLATRVGSHGLFKIPTFRDVYEDQAQENIAREIDILKRTEGGAEKC